MRDLHTDFLPYVHDSLKTLVPLTRGSSAGIVESTFQTFAFIFKYLARQLTDDLCAVFDILSELLGKHDTRHIHNIRFAAEALSFLIRRAGPNAQVSFLRHILKDNADLGEHDLYCEGLSLLIAETIKGVDHSLHGRGLQFLELLLDVVTETRTRAPTSIERQTLERSIINILHHCTADTFLPALDLFQQLMSNSSEVVRDLGWRLCYISASVRKGTRISDWSSFSKLFAKSLQHDIKSLWCATCLASVIYTYGSHSALLTTSSTLVKHFVGSPIDFCTLVLMVAQQNPAYFATYLREPFWQFANRESSSSVPDYVVTCLLELEDLGVFAGQNHTRLSQAVQDNIASRLTTWKPEVSTQARVRALVGVYSSTSCCSAASEPLLHLLRSCLTHREQYHLESTRRFATLLGTILLGLARTNEDIRVACYPRLLAHSGLWVSAKFLEGFLAYSTKFGRLEANVSDVTGRLIENLSLPGRVRRLMAIRILKLFKADKGAQQSDILSICELIETADLDSHDDRSLAIQVRKLSQTAGLISESSIRSLVISFSFGQLTTNYTPLWSYSCETLASLAVHSPQLIWTGLERWFSTPHKPDVLKEDFGDETMELQPTADAKLDSLKCFNMTQLSLDLNKFRHALACCDQYLRNLYIHKSSIEDERLLVRRRAQAIRILIAIPSLAESHSSELVPVFIRLFKSQQASEDVDELAEKSEATSVGIDDGFNWKERTSLLHLFTLFKRPAALAYSGELREVIISLLCSKDPATQGSALTILLHFNDPFITPYEDNLKNLLSDTRARDELTTFLAASGDENPIQDTHRPTVIGVVSRLMYGRMMSRKKASLQKQNDISRTIILAAFAPLPPSDIAELMNLCLLPFDSILSRTLGAHRASTTHETPEISVKQQANFLVLFREAIQQLGSKIQPHLQDMLEVLFYCVKDSRTIILSASDQERQDLQFKIAKNIVHDAYNILGPIFQACPLFDWEPFMGIIFEMFINPRLSSMPRESSQGTSGLLRLLHTWSVEPITSQYLVKYNSIVLDSVFACLSEPNVKLGVIQSVLEMVSNLSTHVEDPANCLTDSNRHLLLAAKAEVFLDALTDLFSNTKFGQKGSQLDNDAATLAISTLSSMAAVVTGASVIKKLLDILLPVLVRLKNADELRRNILHIFLRLLPYSSEYKQSVPSIWQKFSVFSGLFASCTTRQTRLILVDLLKLFVALDGSLQPVTTIIEELNSFSTRRLDTPDFDRRLAAFASFNDTLYTSVNSRAWQPLLHNMVFFMEDENELSFRTNASHAIRLSLQLCASAGPADIDLTQLLNNDLLPAIQKGFKHKNELIRQEWVAILNYAVKECPGPAHMEDLTVLLADGDEEANIFNNILHIQQHRRSRALRRLGNYSLQGSLTETSVANYLLPLVEHFCVSPSDKVDSNLMTDAIQTVGALAGSLRTVKYIALVKRYTSLLQSAAESQNTVIRLIGHVVDAIKPSIVDSTLVNHMQEVSEIMMSTTETDHSPTVDGRYLPVRSSSLFNKQDKHALQKAIQTQLLPPLMTFQNRSKDEQSVSLRIPISLTIVKLLVCLEHELLVSKLPSVLSNVCHILRSRSQDVRDRTRSVLGSIASLLGPKYFKYLLVELKTALQRGYQLHVLGFSVHTILVRLSPGLGVLDYCLSSFVDVLMDDIFGETGEEKDAEGYITKMKELKSSKSLDSFEILAACTSLECFGEIITPLRNLLRETSSTKVIRKMDEVFRRLTMGILRNEKSSSRDVLLMCFNVYQGTMQLLKVEDKALSSVHEQARQVSEKAFLVDLKSRKSFSRDHLSANAHHLHKFALDTLRAVLQNQPALQTSANLTQFVPIMSQCMLSTHEDLQVTSLRALTQVLNLKITLLKDESPIYLERAIDLIKSSPTSRSSVFQASLKFIAKVMDEQRDFVVPESTLAYLLTRLKADLEEPDQQSMTFSLLKSIMARKLVVPELYDVMDEVNTMMVTNQSQSARDIARSASYQFLMTYPQGKGRLQKQIHFLVRNLEYTHASGRRSVMELLALVIKHFDETLIQNFIPTLFFACTMSLINDDDATCREMASLLIKKLVARCSNATHKVIFNAIKSWSVEEQVTLQRASMQSLGLLLEESKDAREETKFFLDRFSTIVKSANLSASYDKDDVEDGQTQETEDNWQVLYYSLQTFAKLVSSSPASYINLKYAETWGSIQDMLLYKHAWIRLSASRLIALLFTNRKTTSGSTMVVGRDLSVSDTNLVGICRKSLVQLLSPLLTEELTTQVAKNLIYLLRFFSEKQTILPPRTDESPQDDENRETCTHWLIRRICASLQSDKDVKRETITLTRKCLIQVLAASTQILPSTEITTFAPMIMAPLYKYSDSQPHNEAQTAIKNLSLEAVDLLKQVLGPTIFAKTYSDVRQAQLEHAQNKRQQRIVESVRDPTLSANKKIAVSEKKRARRHVLAVEHKRRKLLNST